MFVTAKLLRPRQTRRAQEIAENISNAKCEYINYTLASLYNMHIIMRMNKYKLVVRINNTVPAVYRCNAIVE